MTTTLKNSSLSALLSDCNTSDEEKEIFAKNAQILKDIYADSLTKFISKDIPKNYISYDLLRNYIGFAYRDVLQETGNVGIKNDTTTLMLNTIANALTTHEIKKNVLLNGALGTGKTTALKAAHKALQKAYNENYSNTLSVYMTATQIGRMNHQDLEKLINVSNLFIDDLGIEPASVNSYGTNYNPITEILMERYGKKRSRTIISTNLIGEQIKDKYSEQVLSRIKECYQIINISQSLYR